MNGFMTEAEKRKCGFTGRPIRRCCRSGGQASCESSGGGNKDRAERKLPPTGWTWQESVEEGKWAALAPEPVIIPAIYGLMNGVWFRVKQGMQGLLVQDRQGREIVFMVTEPSTRYFQAMTRAEWMPRLIEEVI